MTAGVRGGRIVARHTVRLATLLFAATVVAFVLVSLSPIDPVQQYVLAAGAGASEEQRQAIAQYWGLNDPPVQRYGAWLSAVLRGDLGVSTAFRRPVATIIGERFGNTLALMLVSWVFAGVIGYTLGALMGLFRDRWVDRVLKRICLVLYSTPTFWLGMVFLMLFAVQLGWFPIGFSTPIGTVNEDVTLAQRVHHLILPALTLSFVSFAQVALHTRQKFVDVLGSDYVLFARARGDDTLTILRRHGVRNTLLPMVTLQFASFGELFGGSILAENVFSYPGLGTAVSTAGLQSDVPLLLGITLFSAAFVFVGNSLANIIYGIVDPRISEERPT